MFVKNTICNDGKSELRKNQPNSNLKRVQQFRKVPFRTNNSDFNLVVPYYLYTAPMISSSLSQGTVPLSDHDAVIIRMLDTCRFDRKKSFREKIFINSKTIAAVFSERINFSQEMMLCQVKKQETELAAVMRHIRNALAHGNVSIYRKFICLDDFEGKKQNFRLVIHAHHLILWKSIIDEYTVMKIEQ